MRKYKLIALVLTILALLVISSACMARFATFNDVKKMEIVTVKNLNTSIKINSLSTNSNLYVAVGSKVNNEETDLYGGSVMVESGIIVVSEDGIAWHEIDFPDIAPLNDVKWCGDKFIAVGGRYFSRFLPNSSLFAQSGEAVYISYDGVKWERQMAINGFMPFTQIEWNGEIYVAIGSKFDQGEASGIIAYSKDGVEWSAVGSPAYYTDEYGKNYYDSQPLLNDVKFMNEKFIATGQEILVSEDGIEWKSVREGNSDNLTSYFCIGASNDKFAVIGERKVYYTNDLDNWREVENSDFSCSYKQIVFNGSYYLLFGNTSEEDNKTTIFKSFDLTNWEKVSVLTFSINHILWNGENYLLVVDDGIYSYSPNDILTQGDGSCG